MTRMGSHRWLPIRCLLASLYSQSSLFSVQPVDYSPNAILQFIRINTPAIMSICGLAYWSQDSGATLSAIPRILVPVEFRAS